MIDPMRLREYLMRPDKCPYCGSPDMQGESVDIDGTSATQYVSCVNCGKRWLTVYVLTRIWEES